MAYSTVFRINQALLRKVSYWEMEEMMIISRSKRTESIERLRTKRTCKDEAI